MDELLNREEFEELEDMDEEYESEEDSIDAEDMKKKKRIFGPAGQKFREIVQKHFLTKTLEQLEETDYSNLTMGTFVYMAKLQECLKQILTERLTLKRYYDIGDFYFAMD